MKKTLLFTFLIIGLTGCTGGTVSSESETPSLPARVPNLRDQGPAPELMNEVWLNTDQPLRLADLSGHVVLLDMWTFG